MGPLTAELHSGKGREMGLFPPKRFGEGLPGAWNAKPGTSTGWGAPPAPHSCKGRGSQKLETLWGNGKTVFSVLRAFPAVGMEREGEQFQGAVPVLSLTHPSGAGAEWGCSAHLVLSPRTLKATLVLFPFLSGGTELPQFS